MSCRGKPRTLTSILSPARGLPSAAKGRGDSGQHFVLALDFMNPYDYGFDPPGRVVHRSWQDGKRGQIPPGSQPPPDQSETGTVRIGPVPYKEHSMPKIKTNREIGRAHV